MSLIQSLCLLLITAHLLGQLALRFGQPELLGHMSAGVLLGPALLNWVSASSMLNACADLAVLFVVVVAGLEMRLRDVASMFTSRKLLGLVPGIALPALSGYVLARYFNFDSLGATVVAMCVAVTALPVALRILGSFGLLGTPLARLTIAGALLADILVLLTLGMLSPHSAAPMTLSSKLGLGAAKLAVLLTLLATGYWACKTIYRRRAIQPRRRAAIQLSFALLLILGLAAASDALGLHFAVGAFLGALTVADVNDSSGNISHPLRTQLEGMSNVLFAPLFLAAQGTHFTVSGFTHPAFALSLILVAVLSKLLGGYWGARLHGLSRHDAHGTAIVMNARGLMEMVVASIAYRAGLVDASLFSTLLMVGIVTTLLTPALLKHWQRQPVASIAHTETDR
jgi:Kef-type K+ transport system membrane component KefB